MDEGNLRPVSECIDRIAELLTPGEQVVEFFDVRDRHLSSPTNYIHDHVNCGALILDQGKSITAEFPLRMKPTQSIQSDIRQRDGYAAIDRVKPLNDAGFDGPKRG